MTQLPTVKILILGGKCVGKSAITVRFLTKRFIGEYKSNIDLMYQQKIESIEGTTNVEILDISRCWQDGNDHIDIKKNIEWADAFVIIYNICDKLSFLKAQEFLRAVHRRHAPVYFPIILVGNKRDLEVGRQVELREGRTVALKFGCQFYEISAADNHVGVSLVFESLIREARALHSRRSHPSTLHRHHRKLSIITVSRVFSAMFGKSHNHNNNNNNNNINNNYYNNHNKTNLTTKNNINKQRKSSGVMIPIVRKLTNPTISL